jgi:uncharacterized membrane protein YkvA (DUF1232 family)
VSNLVRASAGTPWGAIASIIFALIYGASPIDLIPDLLPLIGWTDDAIVIPLMLVLAMLQLRRRRAKARSYGTTT